MKKYKVAFFTESNFYSDQIPRNFENARTDIAWMIALEATHIPLYNYKNYLKENFDIGIIIIPKNENIINNFLKINFIDEIKSFCSRVAIMQEGANWFFQKYSIYNKYFYYNSLLKSDFILCHNEIDINYYYGLTKKPVYKMQSLIIEDTIKNINIPERIKNLKDNVIIGGNFSDWHNGFDSYIIASIINKDEIFCPSMGEMQEDENIISNLKHIPYLNWNNWMFELNKFKYAVHLMRTFAAGTFNLNCAYLQIPCIGYSHVDTQKILHLPEICINEIGDLYTAKKIAARLKKDKQLYLDSQQYSKEQYKKYYSEKIFIKNMNNIFDEILCN